MNWRLPRFPIDEDASYFERVIGQCAPQLAWATSLYLVVTAVTTALQVAMQLVTFIGGWLRWITSFVFLLAGLTLMTASVDAGTSCTRGVNCYCDKVKPGGSLADPQLLMCEDFEAPTLHDDVNFGGGAPNWGPPYDDTGTPGWRGINGYWQRTYGIMGLPGWLNGQPTPRQRGVVCSAGGAGCATTGSWRLDDLWNANTAAEHCCGGAVLVIYKNGEFQDEINVTTPTFPGGSGVFDGNQSFAHRVCAGQANPDICTSGIKGEVSFAPQTTFGVTAAFAYASNAGAAGVFAAPWKHNEWKVVANPSSLEGLFLYHVHSSLDSSDPFHHFIFFCIDAGCVPMTVAQCNSTVIPAATIRKGNLFCDSSPSFRFHAGGTAGFPGTDSGYVQAAHWPLGTWGCVRGHYRNLGSTNMGITITLTTAVVTDMVIVDFDGMDGRGLNTHAGVPGFKWNAFSNTNQPGGLPTSQTTFRYEDNYHVRSGVPVSCAQIGFGVGGGGTPPNAPSNLIVHGMILLALALSVARARLAA